MPEISLSWPQPHHIYYIFPGSTAYFFTKAVYDIRSHRRVKATTQNVVLFKMADVNAGNLKLNE